MKKYTPNFDCDLDARDQDALTRVCPVCGTAAEHPDCWCCGFNFENPDALADYESLIEADE